MAASGKFRRLSPITASGGADQTIYTVPAATYVANAYVLLHNTSITASIDAIVKVGTQQVAKETLLPNGRREVWLGHLEPNDAVIQNAAAGVNGWLIGILDS